MLLIHPINFIVSLALGWTVELDPNIALDVGHFSLKELLPKVEPVPSHDFDFMHRGRLVKGCFFLYSTGLLKSVQTSRHQYLISNTREIHT